MKTNYQKWRTKKSARLGRIEPGAWRIVSLATAGRGLVRGGRNSTAVEFLCSK
jgi:hypothetical protein